MVALVLAMYGAAGTGCSLLFTKGPPPPCTTENDIPRVDTALLVASVALAVAGGAIARNPQTCTESWCGLGGEATGTGMLIAGGIGSVVFASSAIVGYGRTARCREAEENDARHPHPRALSSGTSLPSLLPSADCSGRGDAPRVCTSGTGLSGKVILAGARVEGE
jgi:hypothetical protein